MRVTARVAALETTLHIVNTNLTNMSTLFNQFMARYAPSVSGLVAASGGPILVVMPPLIHSYGRISWTLGNTGRGHVEKHEAARVQGGGAQL